MGVPSSKKKLWLIYQNRTLYRLDSKTLASLSLALVHSIPSWLVWAELKCTLLKKATNNLNQFGNAENRL